MILGWLKRRRKARLEREQREREWNEMYAKLKPWQRESLDGYVRDNYRIASQLRSDLRRL